MDKKKQTKIKRRIPVPQKPPKVIRDKRTYNRKKAKSVSEIKEGEE